MRHKRIKLPIYPVHICFVECEDMEVFLDKFDIQMEDDPYEPYASTFHGYFMEGDLKKNCIYLLFNRNNKYAKLKYSIICHETYHAVNFIFQILGEEPSWHAQEPYAYLQDYIFKQCVKFLGLKDNISRV